VLGGGLGAETKKFLIPLGKGPMAYDICFLIDERPKFRVVILPESATFRKKKYDHLEKRDFRRIYDN